MTRPCLVAVETDLALLDDLLVDLRTVVGPRGADVLGFTSLDALSAALRDASGAGLARRSPALAVLGGQGGADAGTAVAVVAAASPATLVVVLGERTPRVEELLGTGAVHDVVGRPWRPAQTSLQPVVLDALDQWSSLRTETATEAIVLVGVAGDPASYRIRDLFTRNPVPHRYLERSDPEAERRLAALGAADLAPPLVITPDGQVLSDPSPKQMWTALGEDVDPSKDRYDLVVVGAGPAGLAVAVNAASEGLDTLLLDHEAPGGQAGSSSRIENYVGFPSGLSGTEIGRRAFTQAKRLGAEVAGATPVDRLERRDDGYAVSSSGEFTVTAPMVVLATGLTWHKIPVPGAQRFEGAGLYYGAARSEARSVAGRRVVVVGGANSAGQAAVFFAAVAAEVVLVVRGPSLGAKTSRYLVEQITALDNVEVLTASQVTAVHGEDHLRSATITTPDGTRELDAAGVFVFIGARPRTEWLPGWVARDERGYVLTGPAAGEPDGGEHATSAPGVFAVGDVRAGSVKRVASAIGEGSVVVPAIHRFTAGRRGS